MTTPQSVQARLVRYANDHLVDPNLILSRYAAERLLYRLSKSRHAERFVLKGAMLLAAWVGDMIRPTRDIDLLGFGDFTDTALVTMFSEIVETDVVADGVTFDAPSIFVAPIREEDAYGGKRLTLTGHLGPARLKVQIDIGIGDAVYPEPQWLDYPSLLDFPHPKLRAEARELATAIRTTFERRRTAVPETPLALTPAFAALEGKPEQWSAFERKNRLAHADFREVVRDLSAFLLPVVAALAQRRQFDRKWLPGGPWVAQ